MTLVKRDLFCSPLLLEFCHGFSINLIVIVSYAYLRADTFVPLSLSPDARPSRVSVSAHRRCSGIDILESVRGRALANVHSWCSVVVVSGRNRVRCLGTWWATGVFRWIEHGYT